MSTENTLVFSQNSKLNSILIILLGFFIPISTSISSILFTLFILTWILEGNFSQKTAHIWQYKACYSTIIIFISLLLGSVYSLASWHDTFLYLKKMSKLLYLPFLLTYFRDPKQRTITINAIILAGLITTILGLVYKNFCPFKNSIDTSLITIVGTFLLINKLHPSKPLYLNLIGIACIALNIFYLYYFSRGKTAQMIFLFLAPICLWQKTMLTNSKKYLLLISLIIILIITLCVKYSTTLHNCWNHVTNSYHNYINNPNNYNQNTVSQRIVFYKNSLALIKQKPLLGWGTGSFPLSYKNYITKHNLFTINQTDFLYPSNPHNEYLSFGVQLGIYGIAMLVWLFYTLFKTSLLLPIQEKQLLQGTLIIITIGCLINSWLMDFMAGNLFIMLTAISLGALPDVRITRNSKTI
jgi:O-antigen ligase